MISPGNRWALAQAETDASTGARIARFLHQPTDATFALQPFAPLLHENRRWLAALVPPWSAFGYDRDVSGDVLLIDTRTGAMKLLGDDNALLVGPEADPLNVFTNGIVLARVWADRRARWNANFWARRRNDVAGRTGQYPDQPYRALHPVAEPSFGNMPGMALCGPPEALTDVSPLRQAKVIFVDSQSMAKRVADRLLAAARLPIVCAGLAWAEHWDGTDSDPACAKAAFDADGFRAGDDPQPTNRTLEPVGADLQPRGTRS